MTNNPAYEVMHMRMYPVPLDLMKEDKIFGGKLSLRQFIILIIGVGLGIAVFIQMYKHFNIRTAAAAGTVFVLLGFFGANFDKDGMTLDKYISYSIQFFLQEKVYVWKGSVEHEKDN
ncbi:PrgI family protein [Thermoanaerobacter thermohydrosulfuricus]|uniref:PrgI family protein n=1 Tax=Thermoanaerobacter thermohydrosulfuricus TaxID=1516 RepID=A0A1I1X9S6_THETY|nr:PrgI family protein [Thermoanaerobacter thermohydrosulfuricus]SDF03360.1 PrgI family protein [Thermoanaerobacter thermohydrosulfuricus]SFE02110.1 PrgI family protein [Thermoanaerobacter thermohydrosulfuricus]HHY79159.1 PrgI family protein [Thermoanaerobacter sp.]